jgi:hypothetical protein
VRLSDFTNNGAGTGRNTISTITVDIFTYNGSTTDDGTDTDTGAGDVPCLFGMSEW